MASTNAELFAIEAALQGVLHPNSAADDSTDIELDYVNSFSLSQEEEVMNARADGKNKIVLRGSKTMSFSVSAEVLNEGAFLFLLGAKKGDDGKITVGGTPSESYTYKAIMKLIFADGHKEIKYVTMKNVVPQIGNEFGTSSIDLQTYEMTFDVNTDDDGNFLVMEDHA